MTCDPESARNVSGRTNSHARFVIATRNRHKVEEIHAILGPGFHCLTLEDFPTAPPVHEDAPTFAGGACRAKAT